MPLNQNLPKLNGRVLWLIPSEAIYSIYEKEIITLADRYNTTLFTPHLTLGGLPDESLNLIISKVLGVIKKKPINFSLRHKSVDCSTSPYQNLIHSLYSNRELQQMQTEMQEVFSNYNPKSDYHVSLMYGHVSCKKLTEKFDSLLHSLPKKIRFNELRITELADRPEFWETVWKSNN